MLVQRTDFTPWSGEAINGKRHSLNIEQLWSTAEIKAIGLARLERANVTPPTKLHRETGTTKALVGDVVVETPTYTLPTRDEFITMLMDRAWVLFGRGFWTKNTQTDWLNLRSTLKTRGTELLAAFDEGGHDIDIRVGSIDSVGSWPT